jgi:hypothetical protein
MTLILGIPRADLDLADLNEPIFTGDQNINLIKNIKIISQANLVSKEKLFKFKRINIYSRKIQL